MEYRRPFKNIMNNISAETKGPKVLYKVSTLAEKDLANNMQEDQQPVEKNQLPPFGDEINRIFVNAKTTTYDSMGQ